MISLGQASNYTASQVWRHLFACGTQRDSLALRSNLAERYGAQLENIALYHTGRSALAAAIRAVAPAGNMAVIVPGLTCIAVVRAIRAAGCHPVFVDIQSETLEYDYKKLEQKLRTLSEKCNSENIDTIELPQETSEDKATTLSSETTPGSNGHVVPIDKSDNLCYNGIIILVQNTLGISWDVQNIEQLASQYGAVIVEDLAHSAGRFYPDGRETGSVGAAVALSFGKGKAIDTISGGALILRGHQTITQPTLKPKLSDRLRDRWYPLFGLISRHLGKVKIGCKFMGVLVKLGWVQRSADAELNIDRRLTHWQAWLALEQLAKLPRTPLREYRLVNNRNQLLTKFRQNNYNFDEIWYDTPVSPARYSVEADFPDQECPNTVKISQEIINFPTWYASKDLAKAYKIAEEYEIK